MIMLYSSENTEISIVAVHIDDLMLAANSKDVMVNLIQQLGAHFELMDLGPIHWLLGIKVM